MTGVIVLPIFLLVFGTCISAILYVSKNTTVFNLMAGWSLFVYIVFALTALVCLVDSIPTN